MSNHLGSYMLNAVLYKLRDYNIFDSLGKEKTLALLHDIRIIGFDADCNNGEILYKIGEELGICYQCWSYGEGFQYGICKECQSGFKYT